MRLRRRALTLATLATLALLVCGASAGVHAAAAGRGSTAAALQMPRFLWGAWIGTQFTGSEAPWSWDAVTAFDKRNAGGRHLNIVHWGVGVPWVHQFNYWARPFNLVQSGGAISLVDLNTGSAPLRVVANGKYDGALRTWASEAATWGHPFLVRFDWEMNGHWYPWGTTPRNKNTPADYVAAWRHIHDIFAAAGATNVLWVWCPNQDYYDKMSSLVRLYPGSRYVNWTCMDGYNSDSPWTSFKKLYGSTYRRIIRIAPSKPMIVGEIASTGHGGSKPHWIRNMFHALMTRFPHIRGVVWYDKFGVNPPPGYPADWPIETSRAASAAFRRGLAKVLARACRRERSSSRALCLGVVSP
jgi:mannan endo-1,4-beta-mannosidase